MQKKILKIEKVTTFYDNIKALKDISLYVGEGEIVSLIGANGAGKTTTLLTISGIVKPKMGKVYFEDEIISKLPPEKIVEAGVCQVPEGRHIFPHLSVLENLEMGAFLRTDKKEIKKNIDYVFSLFPILKERKRQEGGTLSGGEQQMLAISRALMAKPKLLLLDEPSLGLAPIIITKIFNIIKKINEEQNITILLVAQNANLALQISHRGYVIENGQITMEDTGENLLNNENVKKAYLGI